MIVDKEMEALKAPMEDAFGDILEVWVHGASEGWPIRKMEEDLWSRLLSLGRLCLGAYVEAQGTGVLSSALF